MTKKFLSLLGIILIVMTMVVAACSGSTTSTTTTPATTATGTTNPTTTITTTVASTTTTSTTTTAASANTPTYGGKITFIFGNNSATENVNPVISSIAGGVVDLAYDKPVSADWSKGPEGTAEYPLNFNNVPLQYRTGVLLSSWEIKSFSDEIWHVRQGVHFQDKAPANGREMTSADVVYSFQTGQQDTRSTFYDYAKWTDQTAVNAWIAKEEKSGNSDATINNWIAFMKSINYPFLSGSAMWALDTYTCEYKIMVPFPTLTDTGDWMFVQPTESAALNMNDYHNADGTGPYIISDLVQDSAVTFTKNPNYFMTDPNHPGNKLPYADTIVGLVLPDQSTQLAALRTGKVTLLGGVSWDKAASLKQTNPDLKSAVQLPAWGNLIFMRSDLTPFSNVKVRQALNMAVDRDTIINDYFKGNAVADAWPCLAGNAAGYTPIPQMPADVRQYFEYHPDTAKQLLSDAGYPNGLTIQVDSATTDPSYNDELQLVKEEWATIGVTMNIKTLDSTSMQAELYGETYPSAIYSVWSNGSLQSCMGWAHGGVPTSIYAFSKPVDPVAVAAYQQWVNTTDQATADALVKAEYLREDTLCWEVSLPVPVASTFWQPYLGGYKGETTMGIAAGMGETELLKFLWIIPH